MRKPILNINKDWLYDQYITQGKSSVTIEKELRGNKAKKGKYIWDKLVKFGIPIRSHKEANTVRDFTWGKKISKVRIEKRLARGKKNGNWKGGVSGKNAVLRSKLNYWKREVLERDGYKCVACGITKHNCSKCNQRVVLHVDHIKSFSKNPKLRFDVSNGQTLCRNCHELKTKNSNEYHSKRV